MPQSQFVLAQSYQLGSYLSIVIENLRRHCTELCPDAKEPKMGNHITLLQPFWARPDDMRHFAEGLNIARALYGKDDLNNYAKTRGVGFYHNPCGSVCVMSIALPNGYREMIDECHRLIFAKSRWVHQTFTDIYEPHICIAKGVTLYEQLLPHREELQRLAQPSSFILPFPQIMIKETGERATRWREFNPT